MPSRPADIIVIGAGIVGCSIAYELARRGVSVEVVDERMVGMGATQASAGMLAPYIEAHEESPLFDLTVRSLNLFDQFVERVTSESGLAVPYRRTGTLSVVTDPADVGALRRTAATLARRGVAAELLDEAGARTEEPQLSAGAAAGLLIRAHGFVAVNDLTRAAVAAARRASVSCNANMTVIAVGESRYRLAVVERDGRWIAHAVREETGQPFGIDCGGATREDAIGRLSAWLAWQSDHAAAIDALQVAQRAYHRTVAGSAFANPGAGPAALELQKESLAAVEAARVRLGGIRARKPE